jgi:hypothetical protein
MNMEKGTDLMTGSDNITRQSEDVKFTRRDEDVKLIRRDEDVKFIRRDEDVKFTPTQKKMSSDEKGNVHDTIGVNMARETSAKPKSSKSSDRVGVRGKRSIEYLGEYTKKIRERGAWGLVSVSMVGETRKTFIEACRNNSEKSSHKARKMLKDHQRNVKEFLLNDAYMVNPENECV